MGLTVKSFFNNYIVDSLSHDLNQKERVTAIALSVLAGLITLGIIHLICAIIKGYRVKLLNKRMTHHSNALNVAKRVDTLATRIFQRMSQPSVTELKVNDCLETIANNTEKEVRPQLSRVKMSLLTLLTLLHLKEPKPHFTEEEMIIAQVIAGALSAKKNSDSILEMINELGVADISKYQEIINQIRRGFINPNNLLANAINIAVKIETEPKKEIKKQMVSLFGANFDRQEIKAVFFQLNKLKSYSLQSTGYPTFRDVFEVIVNKITSAEFPVIYRSLVKFGIKQPIEEKVKENIDQEKQDQAITEASSLLKNQLLDVISNHKIEEILSNLSDINDRDYSETFRTEISKRRNTFKKYIESEDESKEDAFEELSHFHKISHINLHMQFLKENKIKLDSEKFPITFIFSLHHDLKNMIKESVDPVELLRLADKVIDLYKIQKNKLPEFIQTSVALAYEKAFQIYSQKGNNEKALEVLELAESKFVFDETNPLYDFKQYKNKVEFLQRDCGFLRNRSMRVASRPTSQGDFLEVSVELTSEVREKLEQNLKVLRTKKGVSFKKVNGIYSNRENGTFDEKSTQTLGNDLKISFNDLNDLEMLLGNDRSYYSQHHRLRIRLPLNSSIQTLHKAFTRLGLPMAVMPSRIEDIEAEALAKIITFRFPKKMYAKLPHPSPEQVYESLTKEERAIVDRDLQNIKITNVNNGQLEMVNPKIGNEAKNQGVKALASSINGGDIESISGIIASILKTGSMSSQERYDRGIIGTGCAPEFNCKVGSFNQVFTRILTDNFFTTNYSLNRFAISGSVMLLYDTKVLERMPYTYYKDRGGLRNPHHKQFMIWPENQEPEFNFTGGKIRERDSLQGIIEKLNKKPSPTQETMFNGMLGSQYLRRIIVRTEREKLILTKNLELHGIYQIAGVPLEKAVISASKLDSNMLWD